MRTRTKNKVQYKEEDYISLEKWSIPWRRIYCDLYYRYKEGIIEPSQYEIFIYMRKMNSPNKPRGYNDSKYPPITQEKKKKVITAPSIITFD